MVLALTPLAGHALNPLVQTIYTADPAPMVCNIENGDYIKVKGVDFGGGAKSFEARAASATKGGKIELRLDSLTGTVVGNCILPDTGGWRTWATKSRKVRSATGVHDLYLKNSGDSGSLFPSTGGNSNPGNKWVTF